MNKWITNINRVSSTPHPTPPGDDECEQVDHGAGAAFALVLGRTDGGGPLCGWRGKDRFFAVCVEREKIVFLLW